MWALAQDSWEFSGQEGLCEDQGTGPCRGQPDTENADCVTEAERELECNTQTSYRRQGQGPSWEKLQMQS